MRLLIATGKSDNLFKIALFKTSKIGLAESLGLHNKKSTSNGALSKWCAILCDYRTKFCEDFKDLGKKLELLEDIQKQNQSELLVI